MATLAHFGDPAWRGAEHFSLAVGRSQYLLYHLIGAGVTALVGDALLANRLLLAVAGLTTPFALRALLRALRRDERLAMFACPLFWSRPLVIGFLPFVVSVPLELATLALLVRQVEAPQRRRALALGALGVLLFYLHVSAFLQVSLIALVLALVVVRRSSGLVRHAVTSLGWLGPAAACAALWWALGKIAMSDSLSNAREIAYMSAARSLHAIGLWAHDIWASHVDDACGVAFWTTFAVLLATSLGKRPEIASPWRFDPAYVIFLCALAIYFVLPFRVGAGTMLNVRMASTVAMLAVAALHPRASGGWVRAGVVAAFIITIVVAGDAVRVMRACEASEMSGFDAILERMPLGSRVLLLSFRRSSRYIGFPPWIHVAAYHRVWRGGVASFSFSELSHWSLQYRPGYDPPKHHAFWDAQPCDFRNAEDGPYYDYVIVRGTVDPFRDEPPGPAWRAAVKVHDFTLWEKTGEEHPPWSMPDRGPCVPRSDVTGPERGGGS
jgi:hypothetical protein